MWFYHDYIHFQQLFLFLNENTRWFIEINGTHSWWYCSRQRLMFIYKFHLTLACCFSNFFSSGTENRIWSNMPHKNFYESFQNIHVTSRIFYTLIESNGKHQGFTHPIHRGTPYFWDNVGVEFFFQFKRGLVEYVCSYDGTKRLDSIVLRHKLEESDFTKLSSLFLTLRCSLETSWIFEQERVQQLLRGAPIRSHHYFNYSSGISIL